MNDEEYKYMRILNDTTEAMEIIDCIDLDNDNSINRGIDKMQEVCKKILEDIDNPKIKAIANDPFFTFDKTPLLHKAMEILGLFKEEIQLKLETSGGEIKKSVAKKRKDVARTVKQAWIKKPVFSGLRSGYPLLCAARL